jgi:hypothetical protein
MKGSPVRVRASASLSKRVLRLRSSAGVTTCADEARGDRGQGFEAAAYRLVAAAQRGRSLHMKHDRGRFDRGLHPIRFRPGLVVGRTRADLRDRVRDPVLHRRPYGRAGCPLGRAEQAARAALWRPRISCGLWRGTAARRRSRARVYEECWGRLGLGALALLGLIAWEVGLFAGCLGRYLNSRLRP